MEKSRINATNVTMHPLMVEVFSFLTLLIVQELKLKCRLCFYFILASCFQNLMFSCQAPENMEMEMENIHTIVIFGDILYDDF